MKIQKAFLKNRMSKTLYNYPQNTKAGDKDFKISFSVSALEEENAEEFGGETLSSYHLLLEGGGKYDYRDGRSLEAKPLDIHSCEEGENLKVTGQGRLFHMTMDGGVRGFIRILKPEQMLSMRIGEGVGDCVMAFLGIDGGFRLEVDGEAVNCERDEVVFIEMKNREFGQLKLWPEQPGMTIVSANSVMLSPYDFGKYIGVRFLERGDGTCKARLDVRPEHMNPIGTVHGGCLFTLADAACGIAASSTGGICTTVNSNIQFLNAAFYPKYLTAEVKPKKIGHKLRNFQVEIRDDKERLICTVDFVFYSLQK
ncbi:PaaI family thioesterase [Frisingicoccus sp.]|uniref:PaaI family thioesterase n=1 Tax=Frisingicoccus sp. TaxID=1918627 RepID=UPI003AB1D115